MHKEYLVLLKEKLSKELRSGFPQYVIYNASRQMSLKKTLWQKRPLSLKEIAKRDENGF